MAKLSDLKFDKQNINKHSEFGMALLGKSISEIGWTEAIVTAKDGTIISGNGRTEVGVEKGFDDAIYVESDGTRPVIINRKDIAPNSAAFAKAKILANTVHKHNYVEDVIVLEAVVEDYRIEPTQYGLPRITKAYEYQKSDDSGGEVEKPSNADSDKSSDYDGDTPFYINITKAAQSRFETLKKQTKLTSKDLFTKLLDTYDTAFLG